MADRGPDLKAWSAAVFNNKHLLDVALWISASQTDLVTVRKIAAGLGLADGTVRPVIDRLEKMGLVRRIDGVEQAVPIVPQENELWRVLQEVASIAPKPARHNGTDRRR